jgi:putative ABC transport system permease protein
VACGPVTRMIRVEALAAIGFGVLLGLAIAAATLVPFSLAIAQTPIPYLPWQVVASVLGGATVLGLGASELPARNALRRDPDEVIGAQALPRGNGHALSPPLRVRVAARR